MTRSHTAWVDLASPSHPFFFSALLDGVDAVDVTATVRKKTETVELARNCGLEPEVVGRDFDNPVLRKIGIPARSLQLAINSPSVDVSLSSRNAMCVLASKCNRTPSIHFTDNDITAHVHGLVAEKLYNRLEASATHNVVPKSLETSELTRWGISTDRVHTYDGMKEHVYVADFEPEPGYVDRLPFESDFVVIRPEALSATYVDAERSLVPALLERLVEIGKHVVYLPRNRDDMHSATEYPDEDVYVPPTALNGLQLAWHADCVLTGSGTMAREAACMDVPAVSFFPNEPLSVDQSLIDDGRIYHSRSPERIVSHIDGLSSSDVEPDRARAGEVKAEVQRLTEELVLRCSTSS